jgi:hypothetical protein
MSMDHDKRIDSIWKKQEEELWYWIKEHLGELEAKNISVHKIDRGGGGFSTIIYDIDDKSAVLIQTDTTAPTAKESHEYMMIEPKVLEKLAALFGLPNSRISDTLRPFANITKSTAS